MLARRPEQYPSRDIIDIADQLGRLHGYDFSLDLPTDNVAEASAVKPQAIHEGAATPEEASPTILKASALAIENSNMSDTAWVEWVAAERRRMRSPVAQQRDRLNHRRSSLPRHLWPR